MSIYFVDRISLFVFHVCAVPPQRKTGRCIWLIYYDIIYISRIGRRAPQIHRVGVRHDEGLPGFSNHAGLHPINGLLKFDD